MASTDLAARYTPERPDAFAAPPPATGRPECIPARRAVDGLPVEVHRLDGMETTARAALVDRLGKLPRDASERIVEIASDGYAVVTHPLAAPDLAHWLDVQSATAPVAPPAAAPAVRGTPGARTVTSVQHGENGTAPRPAAESSPDTTDPVPSSHSGTIAIGFTGTIARPGRRASVTTSPDASAASSPPQPVASSHTTGAVSPPAGSVSAHGPITTDPNARESGARSIGQGSETVGTAAISPDAETPPRGLRITPAVGGGDVAPAGESRPDSTPASVPASSAASAPAASRAPSRPPAPVSTSMPPLRIALGVVLLVLALVLLALLFR